MSLAAVYAPVARAASPAPVECDRWLATSAFEATADPVVQSVGASLRELVPRTRATIPSPVLVPDQCGAGVVDIDSFETRRAFPRGRPRRRLGGTSPCLRCFRRYLRWAAGPAFRAQTAPDVEAPHRRPRLATHAVLRDQAFFAFAHVVTIAALTVWRLTNAESQNTAMGLRNPRTLASWPVASFGWRACNSSRPMLMGE